MLYESYIHPLTIMSTLPSAGIGGLLALILLHYDFSLIALIGIILLIGIVKKNGIMMVDVSITEKAAGLSAEDAIYRACLLRFRPIMMTTMAALLGALPLALGSGAGSELRPTSGQCNGWRADAIPGSYPVHHAGGCIHIWTVLHKDCDSTGRSR